MPAVRYIGFFHDRDYVVFGDVMSEGEAFFSLQDAKSKLRVRAVSNGDRCESTDPVCWDGRVATHACESDREVFFSVTEDAYIDLCPVHPDSGHRGWGVVGEPAYRISLGPRGGVHVASF